MTMTPNYVQPTWEYLNGKTKRGRPLLLLSVQELKLVNSFLQKKIKRHCWIDKPENYNSHLTDKIANSYISETNLLLKRLEHAEDLEKEYFFSELNKLNQNLNRIFSEAGWRAIRFEIRQIKKRAKQVRIEVPKALFDQIQHIREIEKLDNINNVIEYLIDGYLDNIAAHES